MPKPPPKIHVRKASQQELIRLLCRQKKSFTVKSTGYSFNIEVKGSTEKYYGYESKVDVDLFDCARRLREDLRHTAHLIDTQKKDSINYFSVSSRISNSFKLKSAYCVDIKAAYLTCVRNHGLISEDTYAHIMGRKKSTRLKALGLLATSKVFFEYDKGKVINYGKVPKTEEDKRFSNVFFFACAQIGAVMDSIVFECPESFLFYWVDGVYLRNKASAMLAESILKSNGYGFRTEKLSGFSVENKGKSIYLCYVKEGEEKAFSIPTQSSRTNPKQNHVRTHLNQSGFQVNSNQNGHEDKG